ncbi:MAG TPA: hypothetical protein VNQ97_11410 [Burkholderiaceae bacterium]|nr:hypothetical protein [Burkholderiaceae bacterium]
MNAYTIERRTQLERLIGLLSCNDLDESEIERIAGVCVKADAEPASTLADNYGVDAAQVARYDPDGTTAFIIFTELEDYFAVADTVDELYEQVIDAFETPALPEYPYDDNDFQNISDFFRWVDQQLLLHHEKYCLISFGESYTNDFQVILVYRSDLPEILSLCATLEIQAEKCD